MSNFFEILLLGEQAMVDFGSRLGKLLPDGCLIFLEGDLGAGKTTLVAVFWEPSAIMGWLKAPRILWWNPIGWAKG